MEGIALGVLSLFTWIKGEDYGKTIGSEMEKGLSLEDAIRKAYKKHGVIPLWKLYSSVANPTFIAAMGGVVGGYYKQKTGFFNEKLLGALIKVTKEMS